MISQEQTMMNNIQLRRQFRIGNSNFSLEACRWKPITFKQKSNNEDISPYHMSSLIVKRPSSTSYLDNPVIPTTRISQTSVLLSDHIYMFGGIQSNHQKQTFCAINLRNNKWHSLSLPSTPINRDSHGITVLKQQIYVFGGSNQERYFNDLCSFNTFSNQWRLMENTGSNNGSVPSPRDPMVFLGMRNQALLLIGGINLSSQDESSRYLEDAYVYKNNQWTKFRSIINYPTNIIKSKTIQINNRIFLYGGLNRQTNQYSNKLYQIIITPLSSSSQPQSTTQTPTLKFQQINPTIDIFPSGRIGHQLVKINNQYFLLIGGYQTYKANNLTNKKIHKDIWLFDIFQLRWIRIEPKNGPLRGICQFSAVMYNNIIYLIGGYVENKKQINQQILTIEFANQQIFKSQICQNCVNINQKKQIEQRKFPKQLGISVGFLYNMALEIKFPFHAITMLYQASKYFNASYFRFIIEKTINQFNYIKIEFDGCTFGRSQFISFITHRNQSLQLKKVTESLKLASLRLGKTFLFITSDKRYRYVYLLSAQSRVSPHFDESYIYYSYIQNIQLQRIETQQGIKQRQFIINIIKKHIPKPQVLFNLQQKSLILIFENKVVMSAQQTYICELIPVDNDIKIWKNDKKMEFLQNRGYNIQQDVEISLYKYMMLYYYTDVAKQSIEQQPQNPLFYINQSQHPIQHIQYKQILRIYEQKHIIHKVELPSMADYKIQISGQIFITTHPHFIQNNYGLLIYCNNKLYTRYDLEFSKLFPQHFYKSKYKQARTIFYQVGYINIEKGLEQDYFMNSFNKLERYCVLLEKIQEKCDEKRNWLLENQAPGEEEQGVSNNQPIKKVKI